MQYMINIHCIQKLFVVVILSLYTVEPHNNDYWGPWDHENYFDISGILVYESKKKNIIELGPRKSACYKRVLLYQSSVL